MPSAKVFTEDGEPYLEAVGMTSTIAYSEFVSKVCEVFQSAIQTMAASPNANVMSVLGAELLANLHGPYAKALAYEYRQCNGDKAPDEESLSLITNVVNKSQL